jgi:hypothetical protein
VVGDPEARGTAAGVRGAQKGLTFTGFRVFLAAIVTPD